MGSRADFRAFARMDSRTGFGTAVAWGCCCAEWAACGGWSDCRPGVPVGAPRGEYLSGRLGTVAREAGEDYVFGSHRDRHDQRVAEMACGAGDVSESGGALGRAGGWFGGP